MPVMPTLLACSRLYNAAPPHAQAWNELFHEIGRLSGLSLRTVDWAAPARLEELWARPDLGMAFLCGRPYLQAGARHRIIAAPLTSESGERPVYRTLLLARASSGWNRIEDSFGSRLGRMPAHSQSGYNALRFMLAPYAGADLLYAESVELETPADCVRALQESRVDVIPLDSFFHLLLADEYPELGRRLVILGASPFTSMPFLAGSPELAPHAVRALRDALELWSLSPAYEDIRKALCLRGFAFPSPADYAALAVQEAEALRLGYPCPA